MATPLTCTPVGRIRHGAPVRVERGYDRSTLGQPVIAAALAQADGAVKVALAAQSVPITAMQTVAPTGGEPTGTTQAGRRL